MLLLISCNDKKEVENGPSKQASVEKTKFEMYNLSPMAALMEQMYGQMNQVKQIIKEGGDSLDLGDFPELHNDLLTAELTDPTDKDFFFIEQAEQFLKLERVLFQSNRANAVENFNAVVNSCLTCHKKKCGGPIPRIQKLLIK
ncbi:hypothetical protein GJV76_10735 [Myroides sp. BIT-d1]|uniref:Cytochrome c n=2 Tax=Flavobacteriaceae TaxID=49546 RepID=A0A6I3LM67_9FLAO|nr:hypothetical protein [Myroides albus]MVX36628.1 hypothetical protein [Myroides sp. LoEW2-1]